MSNSNSIHIVYTMNTESFKRKNLSLLLPSVTELYSQYKRATFDLKHGYNPLTKTRKLQQVLFASFIPIFIFITPQ